MNPVPAPARVSPISVPDLFARGHTAMLACWQPVGMYLAFEGGWTIVQLVFEIRPPGSFLTLEDVSAPQRRIGELVLIAFMFALSWWLSFGVNRVAIDAARSKPMAWKRFFVPLPLLLQVATVLGIMWTGIGFGLLLIVPGMILFLNWCMSVNIMLDGKKSWLQALSFSRVITLKHRSLLSNVFLGYFLISLPSILFLVFGALRSMPDLSAMLDGMPAQTAPSSGANLSAAGSFLAAIGSAYFSFVSAELYLALLGEYEKPVNY